MQGKRAAAVDLPDQKAIALMIARCACNNHTICNDELQPKGIKTVKCSSYALDHIHTFMFHAVAAVLCLYGESITTVSPHHDRM